jgi:hypothetical protein
MIKPRIGEDCDMIIFCEKDTVTDTMKKVVQQFEAFVHERRKVLQAGIILFVE